MPRSNATDAGVGWVWVVRLPGLDETASAKALRLSAVDLGRKTLSLRPFTLPANATTTFEFSAWYTATPDKAATKTAPVFVSSSPLVAEINDGLVEVVKDALTPISLSAASSYDPDDAAGGSNSNGMPRHAPAGTPQGGKGQANGEACVRADGKPLDLATVGKGGGRTPVLDLPAAALRQPPGTSSR